MQQLASILQSISEAQPAEKAAAIEIITRFAGVVAGTEPPPPPTRRPEIPCTKPSLQRRPCYNCYIDISAASFKSALPVTPVVEEDGLSHDTNDAGLSPRAKKRRRGNHQDGSALIQRPAPHALRRSGVRSPKPDRALESPAVVDGSCEAAKSKNALPGPATTAIGADADATTTLDDAPPGTAPDVGPVEAASQHKPVSGALSVSRGKDNLAHPQFVFDKDANYDEITRLRDTFFQNLQNLNVELKSSTGKASFSRDEAIEVTNFFFAEVMGPAALKRLKTVLREYQSHPQDGIGIIAAAKARALSEDAELNMDFRKFFESMHTTQRLSAHPKSSIAGLHVLLEDLRLHSRFQELMTKASNKDVELIAILTKKGYVTKRGVTWKSCAIQYICDSLKISVAALDTTCQAVQGVSQIVELFGMGILVILPPGITTKYGRFFEVLIYVLIP